MNSRGAIAESTARVNRIVVFEPARQLLDDGAGVGPGVHAGVVALQRADEGFGHAVRLRLSTGVVQGTRPMSRANRPGVVCDVAAAVVGQPLDRFGERVAPDRTSARR